MNYTTILLEKRDHIATLTMNRPEKLNAINETMFSELNHALDDVTRDDDVRVLIFTGAGKAFTASTDIRETNQGGDRLLSHMSEYEMFDFIRKFPQQISLKLQKMPKPTIAMVNGIAVADGVDWVMACDIRIGGEAARFMNAFVQLALVSNTGSTWFYPRALGLNKALEFLYTGDWIDAKEALRLGLLNSVFPADQLARETMSLAQRIAARAPIANRLVKEMVYRGLTQTLDDHLLSAAYAEAFTLTTKDHKEALAAFLAKRTSKFTGQ